MATEKPPTQVAGVVGIAPKPIVLTPAPEQRVNWRAFAALPPFQMFLAEHDGPNQTGKNSHEWATEVAVRLATAVNDNALLDEYSAWHKSKGYWPGETPFGQ